jgi:hypothetical protein
VASKLFTFAFKKIKAFHMRNTIRFDWAIKRLLRNKANYGILEGFLSELLGEDIKIESILESESNKETAENKSNRVDLLVQNSNQYRSTLFILTLGREATIFIMAPPILSASTRMIS